MHLIPAPATLPAPALSGPDALASRLANVKPSAGLWDALDFEHLSPQGRIDALQASEQLLRHVQGIHAQACAAAARNDEPQADPFGLRLAEVEAASALNVSAQSAALSLEQGARLTRLFPETLSALGRGEVSWYQARALLESTEALDDQVARAVQNRVLHLMPRQIPATTRKALRRAVLALDPHGAAARNERQTERRKVAMHPEEDGMATIELYTTAQLGAAMLAAVDRHARTRTPGDTRSLDQRRADTFASLVLDGSGVRGPRTSGAEMPQPAALVQVTVGLGTLLGTDEEPGELRGYGPVAATQARALAFAQGSVWRRLITRPDGTLLHADPLTYRPTAAVTRFVQLRDQTCTFPGCSVPAQRCDLDHIQPFDHEQPERGGLSVPQNLHALCRRHHRAKTARAWNVTRDETTGVATWTSPLGRTYVPEPKTYAMSA